MPDAAAWYARNWIRPTSHLRLIETESLNQSWFLIRVCSCASVIVGRNTRPRNDSIRFLELALACDVRPARSFGLNKCDGDEEILTERNSIVERSSSERCRRCNPCFRKSID